MDFSVFNQFIHDRTELSKRIMRIFFNTSKYVNNQITFKKSIFIIRSKEIRNQSKHDEKPQKL